MSSWSTEAAARSGTLNTAAHALAQGKDIFAVPGPITSPMSAGCNHLLRQGAQPLLAPEDILDMLMPQSESKEQLVLPVGTTPIEQAILDALATGIRDREEILAGLDCTPSEFSIALTTLEINGTIKGLGANRWRFG